MAHLPVFYYLYVVLQGLFDYRQCGDTHHFFSAEIKKIPYYSFSSNASTSQDVKGLGGKASKIGLISDGISKEGLSE